MIQLEGLTKRYGSFTAVDSIDLHAPRGELFGLLGPNGAGKTSTLRMLAGILRPDSGCVLIDGFDVVTDPYRAKARLGYIPDRPFVYEKLTGRELLRFTAAQTIAEIDQSRGVGGEIFVMSRSSGKYWRAAVENFCTDSTCSSQEIGPLLL